MSDSDFMIDGNDATGVNVVDGNTLTFSFPTTSDGVHNVSISGLENLQGIVVAPDNFTFQTDDVAPVVVSSSIADGSVLSPGPLTEVITFNKPIQPSSVSTVGHLALRRDPGHRLLAVVDQLRSDRHHPDDHLRELARRRLPVHACRRPGQLPEHGRRAASEQLRAQLHDARRHEHHHRACSRSCRWAAWSMRPRSTTSS